MNKNQKIIAVVVGVLLTIMLCFPPFHLIRENGTFNVGYSIIFSPPERFASVNLGQLMIQFVVVLIAGGIGYFVLTDKR